MLRYLVPKRLRTLNYHRDLDEYCMSIYSFHFFSIVSWIGRLSLVSIHDGAVCSELTEWQQGHAHTSFQYKNVRLVKKSTESIKKRAPCEEEY